MNCKSVIKRTWGQVWPETLDEKEPHIIHAAIALGDEAFELLHTTRWKAHRKQEFDVTNAKKELIDILMFCLGAFNDLEVDATEVSELFYDKLRINNERQDKLKEGDPV